MRRAIQEGYCGVFVERGGRIVLAHGEVVETGGREALRSAFAWLGDLG